MSTLKTQGIQLVEARHLLRKHVLKAIPHGKAVTYKCLECGQNGAHTVAGIVHKKECRVATLLTVLGEQCQMGLTTGEQPQTSLSSTQSTTEKSSTTSSKKRGNAQEFDPVQAALSCTS